MKERRGAPIEGLVDGRAVPSEDKRLPSDPELVRVVPYRPREVLQGKNTSSEGETDIATHNRTRPNITKHSQP